MNVEIMDFNQAYEIGKSFLMTDGTTVERVMSGPKIKPFITYRITTPTVPGASVNLDFPAFDARDLSSDNVCIRVSSIGKIDPIDNAVYQKTTVKPDIIIDVIKRELFTNPSLGKFFELMWMANEHYLAQKKPNHSEPNLQSQVSQMLTAPKQDTIKQYAQSANAVLRAAIDKQIQQ